MNDLRNPFRMQAAEHIESDSDFLKLFGPGVLDLVPAGETFARALFIRSAPGGGKTSLLKLFTPSVLHTLVALRTHPDYRELFQRLKQLGAIDEHSLGIVGVMLSCGRTFPALADLGLSAPRARRLLLALLDARIMLGALRSALTTRRLKYPEDLARVRIEPSAGETPPGLSVPCDGIAARTWAEGLERSICDLIDSLATPNGAGFTGHDALLMLPLLDQNAISVDSDAPTTRWVVLLDDVHKLSRDQRDAVCETFIEQRSRTTVWIAERLEALPQDEVLAAGALPGRDYDIINLEEAWRRTPKRFEAAIATIADRRARMAADVATGETPSSFVALIDENLSAPELEPRVQSALTTVADRVRATAAHESKYKEWVQAREDADGTPYEQLIAWRALEILIERHRRKKQQSFDFALSREELEEKDDSSVKAAAELFVSRELSLPYYFGSSRLAYLGSFNVEQYLRLAGDLFEESLAKSLLRQSPTLSPDRQQAILRGAAETRVRDLPRRAKNGRDVMTFLEAVGGFCRDVTYQPNAPYAPGVNGVAISMQERETLLGTEGAKADPARARFAQMLATGVANNLLHAELDKSVKNQRWMILYLNRVVCLRYDLPLNFGGFRERPLNDLVGWMERGYRSPKARGLPL
ncbi:MAG: ORC-CDC6 family AAA ATPase [Planctomycetota bacterium]